MVTVGRRLAAAVLGIAPLARPIAAEEVADQAGPALLEARELSLYGTFLLLCHEPPVAQLQVSAGMKSIRLHLLELSSHPKKIKRIFKDESFCKNRK
jgi:hypothetical protein